MSLLELLREVVLISLLVSLGVLVFSLIVGLPMALFSYLLERVAYRLER